MNRFDVGKHSVLQVSACLNLCSALSLEFQSFFYDFLNHKLAHHNNPKQSTVAFGTFFVDQSREIKLQK